MDASDSARGSEKRDSTRSAASGTRRPQIEALEALSALQAHEEAKLYNMNPKLTANL